MHTASNSSRSRHFRRLSVTKACVELDAIPSLRPRAVAIDTHEAMPGRSCCFSVTSSPRTYTLSLHDALPIWRARARDSCSTAFLFGSARCPSAIGEQECRSEEHTSELQSQSNLVCRLLLEKKNTPHQHRRACIRHRTHREVGISGD